MDARSKELPTDVATLQSLLLEKMAKLEQSQSVIAERDAEICKKNTLVSEQQRRIAVLEEYLRLQKQKRFGRSSEQTSGQLEIFNEAEFEVEFAPEDDADIKIPQESPNRKKKPGRKPIAKDLPRVRIELSLTDEDKAGASSTFFALAREEVDIIPAQVRVLQYWQEKAVFTDADGKKRIQCADLPPHILPKTRVSPGFLAHVATAKFCDGLPLYRQTKILQRHRLEMARAGLAKQMIGVGTAVMPILNLLRDHQLSGPLINADETPIQVLKEKGRPPDSESQMWVQVGGTEQRRAVLFNYFPSHAQTVPKALFAGYRGYLQTDGHPSYNAVVKLEGIVHVGCWDHARRKFIEAIMAVPKKLRKANPDTIANTALGYINTLYRIERRIKDLQPDDRFQHRQVLSVPVMNELRTWLDEVFPIVAKDGLTGKALIYLNNQWSKLVRYVDHGILPISNGRAENAIRPFVIGRNAWLFADTPAGAHASAALYSLVETAKANHLEPYHYLKHVFTEIPKAASVEDFERLLPWNVPESAVPRLKPVS